MLKAVRLSVSVCPEDAEFIKKVRISPSFLLQEQIKHLRKQRNLDDLRFLELENKAGRMANLISALTEFIDKRGLENVFQEERRKRLDEGIKFDLDQTK